MHISTSISLLSLLAVVPSTLAAASVSTSSTSSAPASSPTTASAQPYFEVTDAAYWSQFDPPFHSQIRAQIRDPVTNTSTSCTITKTDSNNHAFSGAWHKCGNPTFVMKIDDFSGGSFALEFKHQYSGSKGKQCKRIIGTDCTTVRAFHWFDPSTTEGYQVSGGAYTETVSYQATVQVPILHRCDGGCGITSGAY